MSSATTESLQPQPSADTSPSHAAIKWIQAHSPDLPLQLQSWQLELPRTGVNLHYVTARPAGAAVGTVLFVHGWPDCFFGWRYQIPAFVRAGFNCIAVDQRGFGESIVAAAGRSKPESYSHQLAAKDLELVCAAEQVDRVIVVGHDWGGAVVWSFARRFPSLCRAVISLCTPYRPRKGCHLSVEAMAAMMPPFAYQVYFCRRRADAVKEFSADPQRMLAALFRSGNKGDTAGGAMMNAQSPSFLAHFPPGPIALSPLISQSEIDIYLAMMRVSGLDSGLCWYATGHLNWSEDATQVRDDAFDVRRGDQWNALPPSSFAHVDPVPPAIAQPALMVTAGRDVVLKPAMSLGMEEWCPQLRRMHVEGASHWVQVEKHEQVNEGIIKFISELEKQDGPQAMLTAVPTRSKL